MPLLAQFRVLGFGPIVIDHFFSSKIPADGIVCYHPHAIGW